MFKTKLKLRWIIIAVLALIGVYYMYEQYRTIRLSPEEIIANPSILNGAIMTGAVYKGLVLKDVTLTGTKFTKIILEKPVFENVVFIDAKFDDMNMKNVQFKNVQFKDCTFITAQISNGDFSEVSFKGGSFSYRGDINSRKRDYSSYIMGVGCDKVLFDAVAMNSVSMNGMEGSITFKNMHNIKKDDSSSVINGNKLTLRIDNCTADGFTFSAMFEGSTAYVTNSTFKNSAFVGENSKAMYFENCKILDGTEIHDAGTLVIKNSTVSGAFSGKGNWYFEGCEFVLDRSRAKLVDMVYEVSSTFEGDKDSHAFVLGSKTKAPWLSVRGGGAVDMYNMNIENFRLIDWASALEVNLRNVAIYGGDFGSESKYYKLKMKGGKWENVQMYPEVNINEHTDLGELKTYNLTFPNGNPWRGTGQVKTIPVKTPFDWPEIHVPTPTEMGLKDTLE
ncbi:pentapeptide repeat-containing protein [Desulfovibrio litoralis]|uniref:Pentapeptide repeat-containing protein n=1 Tax=Desulfovibrio litoralis DSM 11393 TaxID=1121455 RepID=A0A1M7TLB4_9BACT|nr:pentapeptide repeat-containing protein [Desulfovibrio litoralis]SHN71517.1 Pentapeptide repeat-containing protein [Desulfovibrio litoralis DSM 11393]